MAEFRKMLPRRQRDLPEWEVSTDGQVIGWVSEWHATTTRTIFYRSTAVHPVNGKHVGLESSPDFENRVQAIVDFNADPATGKAHYRELPKTTPPAPPSSSPEPTSP